MRRAAAILLALLLDRLVGDPPNRFHPVAWMGSAIYAARRHAPRGSEFIRFLYGFGVAAGGAAIIAAMGLLLERASTRLPAWARVLAEAAALKTTLAPNGLARAAHEVAAPLLVGDLPFARRMVSHHLVSRDTSTLDAAQIAAAAVESVAENTSDGVVAPLLYYAVLGLPGALSYRYLNTVDAMLGYHDAEREWLGKAGARLDDAANFLPARLTALAFVAAAWIAGGDGRGAWRIWRRDARRTASPNAGAPMSAMAGALGVELAKPGHYVLGEGLRPPDAGDITRSVRLMAVATALSAIVAALCTLRVERRGRNSI